MTNSDKCGEFGSLYRQFFSFLLFFTNLLSHLLWKLKTGSKGRFSKIRNCPKNKANDELANNNYVYTYIYLVQNIFCSYLSIYDFKCNSSIKIKDA